MLKRKKKRQELQDDLVLQEKFLESLANCLTIRTAFEQSGATEQDHDRWWNNPKYRVKFRAQQAKAKDLLLEEAWNRAMKGSDSLLLHLLKSELELRDPRETLVPMRTAKIRELLEIMPKKSRQGLLNQVSPYARKLIGME